jgi:hypothetical protein
MSDIVNYEECIKVVQEGVSNSRLASSLVAGDDGREEEKRRGRERTTIHSPRELLKSNGPRLKYGASRLGTAGYVVL